MAKGNGYRSVQWDGLQDYPGETSRIYSGPLACENFAFLINRQEPGSEGTFHSHDIAEEIYVVLRGQGELRVNDDVITMGVHDAVRVEPGVGHATSNRGSEDVWWLAIGAPADEFIAWDPVAYGPPND